MIVEGLPVAVYELPDGVSKELIDKMMTHLKEKRGKECSLIVQNKSFVLEQLTLEEGRFARTLKQGEEGGDGAIEEHRV